MNHTILRLACVFAVVGVCLLGQSSAQAQLFRGCRLRHSASSSVRPTSAPFYPPSTVAPVDSPADPLPPPVELASLPAANPPPVPPRPEALGVTSEPSPGKPQVGGDDASPTSNRKPAKSKSSPSKVQQKAGKTAQSQVLRPEIPSGATITLLANFLGQETGSVLLDHAGTATACEVLAWRENSVTLQMPCWGLEGPKMAEILIVLPDGRVASRIPILFVSTPDIVIHQDTVGAPMPPGPVVSPAVYSAP